MQGRESGSVNARQQFWDQAGATDFDVAIIGGGVTGASLYHHLCQRGHRVLLADQSDFAAASSQSSGMLVWGGLLYLRNFDLRAVFRFSRARDSLIRSGKEWVRAESIRYIPAAHGGRSAQLVQAALYLYWSMGLFHRHAPSREHDFAERKLIRSRNHLEALCYEEGVLRESDARFVLHWITPHQNEEQIPLNYCAVGDGLFNARDGAWALQLHDTLGSNQVTARAKVVVNCAGVWTDEVNRRFGIRSPVRHLLSKGVYLGLARPAEHQSPLVFEMGEHGDVLTLLPWGPVSLWGPTETKVEDIASGYRVDEKDLAFLLEHAHRELDPAPGRDDIVSLRCGIRPLVVPSSFDEDVYPLDISRRHRLVVDPDRPWISFYGGKLTNCMDAAADIYAHLPRQRLASPRINGVHHEPPGAIKHMSFPGLDDPVPTVGWTVEHEFCHTLADYLRRRTNIAQWVARQGLGRRDENVAQIRRIALELSQGDVQAADRELDRYRALVRENFDRILRVA
jgi:glycerol-3-phosphate dehydrogenase